MEGDSNGDMPNLSFYRNEIQFLPNGACWPPAAASAAGPLSPLCLWGCWDLDWDWGTGAYSFQVAPQCTPGGY